MSNAHITIGRKRFKVKTGQLYLFLLAFWSVPGLIVWSIWGHGIATAIVSVLWFMLTVDT